MHPADEHEPKTATLAARSARARQPERTCTCRWAGRCPTTRRPSLAPDRCASPGVRAASRRSKR
jgi:hypothetical protein